MKTFWIVACLALVPGAAFTADLAQMRAQLQAGKIDEVIPELQTYLKNNSEDDDARTLYAQALSWDHDYDESESEFRIVLAQHPNDHDALVGLAHLREYQNRPQEAIHLIDEGLRAMPQDPEFSSEHQRMISSEHERCCEEPHLFTVHAGAYHEGYSFTDPGNGAAISFQDRDFHGWNAGVGTSYEHRFKLDDTDLSGNVVHPLPWHGASAGFTFGGATRGSLLPTVHGSLLADIPLGGGWSASTEGAYRHYFNANVYSLAPSLMLEKWNIVASAGYSVANAYDIGAGQSTGLSSYQSKLQSVRWCYFQPWISYAYTHESLDEGLTLGDFRAHHYSAGGSVWLGGGWRMDGYYEYETRPDLVQHINRWGTGFSYSWGTFPTRRL